MFVVGGQRGTGVALKETAVAQQRLQSVFPTHTWATPVTDEAHNVTIAAWLRLDNRGELVHLLGDGAGLSDAQLVLRAYLAWGEDCVAKLEGDFALVVADGRDGSFFAARDALGVRPLYFAITPTAFMAAPTAAIFIDFAEIDTSVDAGWLADFVHGVSGDWRNTPFPGVHRLPPGHWLRVTKDRVIEFRYHSFRQDSMWEDTRDPCWLSAYREELIRAVSVRTNPHGLIGVETSGGLDSSAILGVMAGTHPQRVADIHTFGFALCELEPEYILETSAAHGITQNHIFTAAGIPAGAQRSGWQAIGYPTEHANSVLHVHFYQLARLLGVRTLHSGHGGDEAVSNNGVLALQELISRRQWRQVMQDLPGPRVLRPARLAKRLRRRPSDTSHLTASLMQRLTATPLQAEVFNERSIAQRVFAKSKYDAPFTRVNDFVLGDRVSAMTSIRTADCSLVAASFGIDYRWALLDRRLIQQYLDTPSVWKFGQGSNRFLHRCAMEGFVPDKVVWKQGKDMGERRWPWLQPNSRENATPHSSGLPTDGKSAGELLEQTAPQIAELLDPSRLQSLLEASDPQSSRNRDQYLRAIATLSDWLADD